MRRYMHLFSFGSQEPFKSEDNLYTREKSLGIIENTLPFCNLVRIWVLLWATDHGPWSTNLGIA